jgi:hypothetical protein
MIMALAHGGGSNLEERLDLVSKMLEEAVVLLRSTMAEVRQEAEGGTHDESGDQPGPDRRAR